MNNRKKTMQGNNKKIINNVLYIGILLVFLILVAGLNFAERGKDRSESGLESLTYFQDFSIPTTDGGTFTQDDLKGYYITLINGWGPWCSACVSEMPALEELSGKLEDKGIQIVGVVADYHFKTENGNTEYASQVDSMISATGVTYTNLLADERFDREVRPTMNNMYPGTWIVDSNGKLLDFQSGAKSPEEWIDIITNVFEGKGKFQ